jgi:hypothetical protein
MAAGLPAFGTELAGQFGDWIREAGERPPGASQPCWRVKILLTRPVAEFTVELDEPITVRS